MMWLNTEKITDSAISSYRQRLLKNCPSYIVIDHLFNESKLEEVMKILQQAHHWQTQKHTYSALYVDDAQWNNTTLDQRFVQRDVWQNTFDTSTPNATDKISNNPAHALLSFLRGNEFMSLLSRIFNTPLTDINVAEPKKNTNYFRLNVADFVEQHADDSPGREVCMLLYLNQNWDANNGGALCFSGKKEGKPIHILPLYNRCVLFDPSSTGSEHWVEKLHTENAEQYRYNITSWYWSE